MLFINADAITKKAPWSEMGSPSERLVAEGGSTAAFYRISTGKRAPAAIPFLLQECWLRRFAEDIETAAWLPGASQ